MATQPTTTTHSNRGPLIGGIILIVIGILALLSQLEILAGKGVYFVPALGVIFLAWGLLTRTFGLIIPGGILSGVGLGTVLLQGPLAGQNELAQGGAFLLVFAAGWVLIALLSKFTAESFQWWPLIPAGIMGAIGGLLMAGETGLQILKVIGYAWPLALIAAGAWIILRKRA